jgi:hypothetical protein
LIYHGRVRARGILVVGVAVGALFVGCALRAPIEQRTTQGPTAEQLWAWRMKSQLGREPSFDERRHFDEELELRIGRYLSAHPDDANSLRVSAFRFDRRVSVGMSRDQVAILLGPPVAETGDAAAMAREARRFWPDIQARARAAWTYPMGWTLYFGEEERVVDITRFQPAGREEDS